MGSGLLSPLHVAIVVGVILLVFGPKRLPEIGRSVGRGIRDFKEAVGGTEVDSYDPPRPAADAPRPTADAPRPAADPPTPAPAPADADADRTV